MDNRRGNRDNHTHRSLAMVRRVSLLAACVASPQRDRAVQRVVHRPTQGLQGASVMKLTDAKIRKAKPAGRQYKLADGRGLTLLVMPHGSKLWRFRYRYNGKESMLSLGCYPDVTLNAARDALVVARRKLAEGENPATKPHAQKLISDAIKNLITTEAVQQRPRTIKNAQTLAEYLYDELGATTLDGVDGTLMAQAIARIVNKHGYAAGRRGLQMAKRACAAAVVRGDIRRDPIASMPMPVENSKKTESRKGVTTPEELAQLMKDIQSIDNTVVRLGVQLLALCFPRPGELLGARWNEMDIDSNEPKWIIPAERMKMGKEHVVPLSKQAVSLLVQLKVITGNKQYVLAGRKGAIGKGSFVRALNGLGYAGKHQPHGFRVTGSTLLHEQGHSPDVIETAQARTVPGVRGVYNRSHLLPQRRELLQTWADYIDSLLVKV